MGHPDFRVRGKIFATLWPDEGWGMVKLTPAQQALFLQVEPDVFVPVKGGWGRQGCTNVLLEAANPESVRSALRTAWRNTAPMSLAANAEDSAADGAAKRSRRRGKKRRDG
jgi:hypothetical protein